MLCDPTAGCTFFLLHLVWVVYSHFHHNGRLPEWYCVLMFFVHLVFMTILIYGTFLGFVNKWSYLGTIIALTFLLPPAMSIFQSMKSSIMYCKYLIPFMFSMSFYVTGVSSYSLARFHDSSWGTRSSEQARRKKLGCGTAEHT